ncbi:hypothetical protein V8E54_012262, partial [Elaphomyces granulatus]
LILIHSLVSSYHVLYYIILNLCILSWSYDNVVPRQYTGVVIPPGPFLFA